MGNSKWRVLTQKAELKLNPSIKKKSHDIGKSEGQFCNRFFSYFSSFEILSMSFCLCPFVSVGTPILSLLFHQDFCCSFAPLC